MKKNSCKGGNPWSICHRVSIKKCVKIRAITKESGPDIQISK